jgi:hypothetical protein
MRLGEFIDIINDGFLVISVISRTDLEDRPAGTVIYQGEIADFQNMLVDSINDVYLDELYLDTIDIDEYGIFTIYVC